ncbi:hypothetical protein TNCV_2004531 [Trichonephila clavipes]|nr:hypothetical protein TNCV_2004531 [Trichonephila clavipes]
MACDAEDRGFQMLNDDEIVTFVQEESNPVDVEIDEDEDNNNKSSKDPSNADSFSLLWSGTNNNQSAVLLKHCFSRESEIFRRKNKSVQCVRFHIRHGSHSVFGYPNNRVSERYPVPIDSDKRRSTVLDCLLTASLTSTYIFVTNFESQLPLYMDIQRNSFMRIDFVEVYFDFTRAEKPLTF